MRVTLTAIEFDPLGVVHLDVLPDTNFGQIRRRMSRVATLDGGAVVNDFGYSEADRELSLTWTPKSRAQQQAVARLVQTYPQLRVATREGLFRAAVESFDPGASESTLTLLSLEKLA